MEKDTSIFTKKNIFRIAMFLIIAGVLFFVISIPFEGYHKYGHAIDWTIKKELEMAEEEENVYDLLFFGDSISLSAFYPDVIEQEYGIMSYNCATEGQWLGDMKLILEFALTQQKPKAIVLEANCVFRGVSEEELEFATRFPLLKYHLAPMFYLDYSGTPNATRGFKDVETAVPYDGPKDYMNNIEENEEIPEENILILNDIYSFCRENNITMIMASAPIAHSVTNAKWTSWTNGKHAAVQKWCDQHSVAYYDYNLMLDEIGFDWNTDTRDAGDHVNKSGAVKISLDLAEKLTETGLFEENGRDE